VYAVLWYNRERRLFQESVSCSQKIQAERLLQALVLARDMCNPHFCYWLVRNHVGDLSRKTVKQAPSRRGKRKRITK
jgi:hypothetical protein